MNRILLKGKVMVDPNGHVPSAAIYLHEPTPGGKRRLFFIKCPKQFLDVVCAPDWSAEVSFTADPFGNRPAAVRLLNKHVSEETAQSEHGTC